MQDDIDQDFQDKLTDISQAWNLTSFQRDKSGESIRFVDVSGGQWEGVFADQFANRPKMELDVTSQAVNMFNAEWRKSRFAVKYRPDDTKTSEDDAELLNKLYRTDYRNSNGNQALDTAVDEMSKGGVGAVKLQTKYLVPDDPEDKRQVIEFKPVINAYNMLVWDPQAKEKDKSDANWCSVITTYTEKAFKKAYPDLDPLTLAFQPTSNNIFNYQNMRLIYVSELYEVVTEKGMAFSYKNDSTGEKRTIFKKQIMDHLDELADFGFRKTGERMISKRIIKKSIMYGGGYIEEPTRIAGSMIPIAPCYGFRSYVDGQEYFYGLVEKKKDPQRALNMAFSNNVENSASSPKSMPILTAEQVSGLETRWSEQHLGKYNYAVINGKDENGDDLPLGPVGHIEPAQVDPNSAVVIETASNYIQGQSGGTPADMVNPDASGKAIQESVTRINLMSFVPMDNISDMQKQIGAIYNGMASEIYAEQRFMHLMNKDGSNQQTLLQQYIPDPYNEKGFIKINDVTDKLFQVIVDTGPSYENMRRETVNTVSEIIRNTAPDSPYMPMLYGTLLEAVEGAEMDDIKDFNRKQMLLAGHKKPETDEDKAFLMKVQQEQAAAAEQGGGGAEELLQAESKRAEAEAVQKQTSAGVNIATAANKEADTAKKKQEMANDQRKADLEARQMELDIEAQEIENDLMESGAMDLIESMANSGAGVQA